MSVNIPDKHFLFSVNNNLLWKITDVCNCLIHFVTFLGTAAGAVNFQAYLLDGIVRWNTDRASAAVDDDRDVRSFDIKLQERANQLSMSIHGSVAVTNFT